MDELRPYETEQDIAEIVEKACEHIREEKPVGYRLAQGLFTCNFSSANHPLDFTDHDIAKDDEVRRAAIICLGGIDQVQHKIGAVPSKCREFFERKGLWPKNAVVLTHDSRVEKTLRFKEEYQWVRDKAHASTEMDELAGQIFRAKFLNGDTLVTPKEFQGFCFLTYSFGNRMAEMVVNGLRQRLAKKLGEQGLDGYAINQTIQDYFGTIKMVSIASSVDIAGLAKNGPSIAAIQLINRNDRAVPYWKPFADRFIIPASDSAYKMINLEQAFGKDGKGRTAIVFTPAADGPVSSPDDKGHSLHRYMDLMETLEDKDLAPIGEALNISQAGRSTGFPRRAGGASPDSKTLYR